MTSQEAKKIASKALSDFGWTFEKLTAQTVHFSDLARGSGLFVKIHGLKINEGIGDWERPTRWAHVKEVARMSGFFLD